MLSLVRELIALRRELGDGFELLDAADGVVAFRRGDHTVAINTTVRAAARRRSRGEPRIQTRGRRAARRRARSARRSDCRGLDPLPRGYCPRRRRGICTEDTCSPSPRSSRAPRSRRAVGSAATRAAAARDAINWYVFNEPGGSYDKAVADCNKEAGGQYKINYVKLPTDANQQRELIVRRLAAEDKDIDLIGMDVIWTAELAEAGWILPVGGRARDRRDRGQARGPGQDRGVQGQGLRHPVHEQHAAALVPQGPRRRAARRLHLGRDDRRGGRQGAPPSRCRPASTRA